MTTPRSSRTRDSGGRDNRSQLRPARPAGLQERHNVPLSTKREYSADGSPFAGVDIPPDIVLVTAESLRAGDPALDVGKRVASGGQTP